MASGAEALREGVYSAPDTRIASGASSVDEVMKVMWNGGGWGGWPMWLGMVLFWGGIIVVIVLLLRRSDRAEPPAPPARDARSILEARYARGEIDEEELERRTRVLEQSRGQSGHR